MQRGSACGGWSGSITDPAPACFVPDDGEICTDESEAGPNLLLSVLCDFDEQCRDPSDAGPDLSFS